MVELSFERSPRSVLPLLTEGKTREAGTASNAVTRSRDKFLRTACC
jgi:hypothetical protein